MAFTTNQTIVAEIAQATYGRVLADTGLDFYANGLTDGTYTEASIMEEFMTNNEAALRYPATTNSIDAVQQVFNNVLGRSAADVGAQAYADLLDAGTLTKTQLVTQILSDAKSGGGDQAYLNAKTAAAEAAYTPTDAGEDSEATDDAIVAPGTTFTMTNVAADAIAGTIRADVVNAASGTFQAGDIIADAVSGDADVLNIDNAGTPGAATVTNIETININGSFANIGYGFGATVGTVDTNVSTSIATGTAALTGAAYTASQNISAGTNIQTLTVATAGTGTKGNVTINTGSAQSAAITGGAAGDTYTVNTTAQTTGVTGAAGQDNITVNYGGVTSALTVDGAVGLGFIELLTLGSTGAANIVNVAGANQIAGALAGNSVTATGDQNLSIRGDLILLGGGTVANGVAVDSSANTAQTTFRNSADSIAGATFLNKASLDNVEITMLAGGTTAITMNEDTTLTLMADVGTGANRTIDVDNATGSLAAGTGTLEIALQASQGGSIITGAKVGVVTIDIQTLVAATINDLDTITTSAAGTTAVLTGAQDLTITTWDGTAGDTLVATTYTGNLTVATAATGTTNLTIVGGTGIDSLTFGATDSGTILGGAGDDTITGAGLADTLFGNEGNDNITGAVGADVLDGGAGVDTFNYTNAANISATTAGAFDIINNYEASVDIINNATGAINILAGGSTAAAGTAAIDANGLASFNAGDVTLAQKVTALDAALTAIATGAHAQSAAIFEQSGQTYLLMSEGTDGVVNTDVLIQLTGVTGATQITISGGDITSIA